MAKEFPATLLEFEHWFRTEDACLDYLAGIRWPEGFRCPRCRGAKSWRTQRGLWQCTACGTDVSVTAGTSFHRSKVSLRLWFRSIWWLTNQKTGVNAMGLQRLLGLGSYRTAWMILHKLRRAMVRPGRELLSGKIELDETIVGGLRRGGPGKRGKSIVIIAVEIRGQGMGRIRLERLSDDKKTSIVAFVKRAIAPGSEIISDGWWPHSAVVAHGYSHDRVVLDGMGKQASIVVLPRIHRVASLLKRWLLGTYQGRVSRNQLDHYLDEFAFRFNRRLSGSRGQLFYRLIQQCVVLAPTPYRTMVGILSRNARART